MSLERNFSNTVADKKEKKQEIAELTVLGESDKNTIFNLLFAKTPDETSEE